MAFHTWSWWTGRAATRWASSPRSTSPRCTRRADRLVLPSGRTAMPGHLQLAQPSSAEGRTETETSITVVLADDHTALRRSLRRLLDGEPRVNVIAEASDLDAATREVHARLPRVLVLDLGMPDGSSMDTVRRLRAQVPHTEVVMLTMDESPLFAQMAFDAGAIGFV